MHGVGATVADPAAGWGRRNMKSMWPPSATIFCIIYFYKAGWGGHCPLDPPGSATVLRPGLLGQDHVSSKGHISNDYIDNRLWSNVYIF